MGDASTAILLETEELLRLLELLLLELVAGSEELLEELEATELLVAAIEDVGYWLSPPVLLLPPPPPPPQLLKATNENTIAGNADQRPLAEKPKEKNISKPSTVILRRDLRITLMDSCRPAKKYFNF
ncbi:hypothetical protein GCM10011613_33770 [Cellvibrio zantedeschiae]|uniref:Uncharacterized protein n=1 Tax=Cellvibrio zantedeschiae TaxID=1237077 RepID=A0ABQ3B9E7_9GAMM|nr:hypothetical protein GCM10011613_33770 [Cellvibrio zantedeschiae]